LRCAFLHFFFLAFMMRSHRGTRSQSAIGNENSVLAGACYRRIFKSPLGLSHFDFVRRMGLRSLGHFYKTCITMDSRKPWFHQSHSMKNGRAGIYS